MSTSPLKETFALKSAHTMTLDEISRLLEMPTSFPRLVSAHIPAEIATKSFFDTESLFSEQEILKFVPERYPPLEDGREMPAKDFWLQVHIKGIEDNPIMGVKFMDIGNGAYDLSCAFLTSIIDGDLYYRPNLGHFIIEQVEAVIHNTMGKPLKLQPPELRHS